MSTQRGPRRVRALNAHYADRGGIASYVVSRLDGGMRMEHLAEELGKAIGENVPVFTLYAWARGFRAEVAGSTAAGGEALAR